MWSIQVICYVMICPLCVMRHPLEATHGGGVVSAPRRACACLGSIARRRARSVFHCLHSTNI